MFKKYKQLIVGFALGGLVFGGITALANSEKIEVLFDNIKIKLYGQEVKMDSQPFIYEGRTYVPLRFVSENLGFKVDWRQETNTVELSQENKPSNENIQQSQTQQQTSSPYNMHVYNELPQDSKSFNDDNIKAIEIDGEVYLNAGDLGDRNVDVIYNEKTEQFVAHNSMTGGTIIVEFNKNDLKAFIRYQNMFYFNKRYFKDIPSE